MGSDDRRRSIVYVDGFNFYYGLLRRGPHTRCKWLDLERLFVALRQNEQILLVKYFTAFWPDEGGERHKMYCSALEQSPRVRVITGRFKRKFLTCRVETCKHSGQRSYTGFEEKETDINIALHMLEDAFDQVCDRMVLVSGDTDLVAAVNTVRRRRPELPITLYVPGRERFDRATDLRNSCDEARIFPEAMLAKFQLPARVGLPGGRFAQRPPGW